MSVRIKKGSSRLAHAELVVVDGIEFWTRPNVPDITPESSDSYHTTSEVERLDLIADNKYRRDDWWWVLAHRNDYNLVPNDVETGKSMVIPRASLIRKDLF